MTTVGAVRRPAAWSWKRESTGPVVLDGAGTRLRAQFPPRPTPQSWPENELSSDDLLALLLAPPYTDTNRAMCGYRRRGLTALVGWLQAQPGQTWQQRWTSSGIEEVPSRQWHRLPIAWWAGQGRTVRYQDLTCGMQVLLASACVRPSYRWLLARQNAAMAGLLAHARDPEGFAHLHTVLADRPELARTGRHVLGRIAIIMLVKGGTVRDITVGDCRELWETSTTTVQRYFYELLRAAGVFPDNAPPYLRQFLTLGQLTIEAMVDQYGIACEPVRDLLVDYLKERQPTLDHSTLTNFASILCNRFWRDLERHHPGINSLRLAPEVAEAWRHRIAVKTRTRVLPTGEVIQEETPRAGAKENMFLVRAFYLDIAHWAVEDPRWALWAAPCPIRPQDLNQTKDKKHRKSRIDQRTRERLPVLPLLVQTVQRDHATAAELLRVAAATAIDATFSFGEATFRRFVPHKSYANKVWVQDTATGKRRNLSLEEDTAFWTWAVVEVLRHTGIRCEELRELSHHCFIQYRLPTTGELVPLLQIAPSKTDAERLLLISPELADVLATIVARVREPTGAIPCVASYDVAERVWNPPMPLLLQRRIGNENRGLTRNWIAELLDKAVARTGLTDAAGAPLRFTPHDFRRLFVTDAILNGLPPHIAQIVCGHADINTTLGYKAVYPEEAINAHRAFIARRRKTRPSEEYRTVTEQEWNEFLAHPVDCTMSRSMTGLAARRGGRTWCGRGHAAGAGRRAAICPGGGRGDQVRVARPAVRGRGQRWRAAGAGRRVLKGSGAQRREPADVPKLRV